MENLHYEIIHLALIRHKAPASFIIKSKTFKKNLQLLELRAFQAHTFRLCFVILTISVLFWKKIKPLKSYLNSHNDYDKNSPLELFEVQWTPAEMALKPYL